MKPEISEDYCAVYHGILCSYVLLDYLECVGSAGLLLFCNAGNQSPGILEAMPYNWALHPEPLQML